MLIRKKDKENIIALAKKVLVHPVEVWAYGSRVNGTAHDTSDLDMVLVTKDKSKVDLGVLMKFKKHLQDSNIPILTQVLDWNRIPESFHKNILENYEVLVKIEA